MGPVLAQTKLIRQSASNGLERRVNRIKLHVMLRQAHRVLAPPLAGRRHFWGSWSSAGTKDETYDAVVVGAGIIGTSTALALQRKGFRVATVVSFRQGHEKGRLPANNACTRISPFNRL